MDSPLVPFVPCVALVPPLMMVFALGLQRLEARVCGSVARDDELDDARVTSATQITPTPGTDPLG